MKGQQVQAITGGTFWKNSQHITTVQSTRHFLDHAHGIFAVFSFNVQRTRPCSQSTQQRPFSKF